MQAARLAAAFALAASLGCMTLDTQRDPGYEGPRVYSGVRKDVSYLVEGPGEFGPSIGWMIFALGDFPFSLVADTVILPITIPRDAARARKAEEEAEVATERPSPVTPGADEAPLAIARRLFDVCKAMLRDNDPHLVDCYSIDARIDVSGRGVLRGADYKVELRAGLERDRSTGALVEWRNPSFAADGPRVRIDATRASSADPPRTPISLVVGPCADGAWRIVEESSIGWKQP